MKNSGIMRILTLMLGIVLAAVIFAQLFQNFVTCQKELKATIEQTENSEKETVISLPSFSMPTPVSVEQEFNFSVLFEILTQDGEEEEPGLVPAIPSASKFFQTLFNSIISPNAP